MNEDNIPLNFGKDLIFKLIIVRHRFNSEYVNEFQSSFGRLVSLVAEYSDFFSNTRG